MKKSVVRMVIVCFALAVSGNAKAADAPATAPSAINEMEQLAKPLAGTLFFDPIQRARMDRARKTGSKVNVDVPAGVEPSVINGFVKRGDGRSVVWIDSVARYDVQPGRIELLQPQDVGGESVTYSNRDIQTSKPVVKRMVKKKFSPKKSKRLTSAARKKQ